MSATVLNLGGVLAISGFHVNLNFELECRTLGKLLKFCRLCFHELDVVVVVIVILIFVVVVVVMVFTTHVLSILRKGVFGLNVIGRPVCMTTGGVIFFIGEYLEMLLLICGKHSKMNLPEVYFPILEQVSDIPPVTKQKF